MLYKEIQNVLQIFEIEFALSAYAYDRPEDIYILIPFTVEAYEQTENALASIGFQSELPLTPAQIFHFRHDYVETLGLKTWGFGRDRQRVQVYLTHGLGGLSPPAISALTDYAPAPRRQKDKKVSFRLSAPLLEEFKKRARQLGVPYQNQIRRIMTAWLMNS